MVSREWRIVFVRRRIINPISKHHSSLLVERRLLWTSSIVRNGAIFGFFASGLAALESFSFAVYVIGAHYEPNRIGISDAQLKEVYPRGVVAILDKFFPNAPFTTTIRNLIDESTFERWNDIRNILSHRAIPPRSITFSPGSETLVTWLFTKEKYLASDEDLSTVPSVRRPWLSASLRGLWDALEQSFPP